MVLSGGSVLGEGARVSFVVIPAKARLQGLTPAWMQAVEPRLEQAAEVVERRREQAGIYPRVIPAKAGIQWFIQYIPALRE